MCLLLKNNYFKHLRSPTILEERGIINSFLNCIFTFLVGFSNVINQKLMSNFEYYYVIIQLIFMVFIVTGQYMNKS